MTALDVALQARANARRPIQVGLVGAGVTGRSIALQLLTPVPGIRLAAVANRTLERAHQAYREGGAGAAREVDSARALDSAIARQTFAVTTEPELLCEAATIDVIIEATGTVDYAARLVERAIGGGKHVVLVNAELDSTLGPILARRAVAAGVVFTNTDGDEPGVAMTLLRYLRGLGLRPVAAGNIKGMVDHYRTPETQRDFAARHGQDARKVTSFADATKLSMEAAILANATGFAVGRRGMHGPPLAHVSEIGSALPPEQLLSTGLVDYALGAAPHTGAFVVIHEGHPEKQRHLAYYKLGNGPFYVFHTPYHLPHIQIASTIGRAALHGDPTVAPGGGPVCEVLAMAKRDLRAGELLDGVGGFTCYGLIDNARDARRAGALPMGLSEGCVLARDLPRDALIRLADVTLPEGRRADELWREQVAGWPEGGA
jgi:predicted homoserine dehydrogenase-like protein